MSCTYYTGWNIVPKVQKMLDHLGETNDDYCMCIASICVHLEAQNGEKNAKNNHTNEGAWNGYRYMKEDSRGGGGGGGAKNVFTGIHTERSGRPCALWSRKEAAGGC